MTNYENELMIAYNLLSYYRFFIRYSYNSSGDAYALKNQ